MLAQPTHCEAVRIRLGHTRTLLCLTKPVVQDSSNSTFVFRAGGQHFKRWDLALDNAGETLVQHTKLSPLRLGGRQRQGRLEDDIKRDFQGAYGHRSRRPCACDHPTCPRSLMLRGSSVETCPVNRAARSALSLVILATTNYQTEASDRSRVQAVADG